MGLAVGAIVGGWGAYAAHKLWQWLKLTSERWRSNVRYGLTVSNHGPS
jgi:hypothetical protein